MALSYAEGSEVWLVPVGGQWHKRQQEPEAQPSDCGATWTELAEWRSGQGCRLSRHLQVPYAISLQEVGSYNGEKAINGRNDIQTGPDTANGLDPWQASSSLATSFLNFQRHYLSVGGF